MPIYKKVNKSFFKKWSSEMAYVLGFFMADGSLDVNPRGSHYFSIQICDKELLENIKKSLNSEHKIATRKGVGNESNKYRLQIGSREMCDDLRKLGVNEYKTFTMGIPDVPKKYVKDFIRGYFDGDGNVWVGVMHKNRKKQTLVIHTAFTSCSLNFLNDLQNLLEEKGLGRGCIYTRGNVYCLKYSIKDSLNLSRIMYNGLNNNLFLQRKKIKFDNYIKSRK